MSNTARSFKDKWTKNPTVFFADTLREGSDTLKWILTRNGFGSLDALRELLAGKARVLDAGCGNGRVTQLLRRYSDPATTEIVGIDLVAADIARANLSAEPNVRFEQRDLLGDLHDLGHFDFIYCQEVLHHTADPRRAFLNLSSLLSPGGEVAIYVYKEKAPAREFVDDYVRKQIAELPYEDAMQVAAQITELGRALAEIQAKVKVPAIPVLGIEAGEYDVQRFVYHFFMKCYWNPEMSEKENTVINYDWYHPQLATRHSANEIDEWFAAAGLQVIHRHVDFYGITVRGVSPQDITP